ncbi:hypothetical protein [Oxalobacter formigenes]|uniref:hypothetical protein n=1 Tax=Oxalobacter formigenes TaxID=847 RepID=UPI0002FB28EA|nr:hypothetical protein [Oxalobacter formigenes]ARQ44865.1 hypothetical protein BRW83_0092 [Oxalobacter formigenes]ARQ77200.1 hypothetical protein BRW84_00100 [Oxalobacter formigenes OXCC13]MCZ4062934.1 hypothetical protein [Oxalobacter formigenes]WAW01578.1 hypothetical protein NB644_00490 [Oxalobacter formigenes]WAW03909.1 hypothetical protein NB642_01300 [Oxalobacter formigenes]
MGNAKLFSYLGSIVLAAGTFLLPATASAGNWSVNIGVPVVVASPVPAVVYSAPVVPVTTVVQPAPVVYPYVSGVVVSRHPVPHYYRGRYRGHRGYHRGHR